MSFQHGVTPCARVVRGDDGDKSAEVLDMRIKANIGAILALGMMASAAASVRYANIVFNSSTRWLFLAALFGILIFSNRLFAGLRNGSMFFGSLFLLYGILTTFLSTIPVLSASKSILYLLCGFCYSGAASIWAKKTARNNVLHILWPLVALTLFAGLSGSVLADATQQMNEFVSIYRGLTFSSNFLGLLTLISLPLPLWLAGRPISTTRQRRIAYILLSVLFALLIQTVSRASILTSCVLILFFLMGLGAWRKSAVLVSAVAVAATLSAFGPQMVDDFVVRFAFKGDAEKSSLLSSREDAFADSLEGAQAGGLFGLGFGVSYGFNDYEFGQGSALYGREKGNVSLAIIEETGIVGLFLFVGMITSILASMFASIRLATSKEDRLLLFILTGILIALVIHAQFEAWLLSPGGAATPFFWAMIGIANTVSLQIRQEALAVRRFRRNSLVINNIA